MELLKSYPLGFQVIQCTSSGLMWGGGEKVCEPKNGLIFAHIYFFTLKTTEGVLLCRAILCVRGLLINMEVHYIQEMISGSELT